VRFDARLKEELINFKGNKGAAQLIRAQEAINSVAEINVDDEGVVTDIDTLDDLRRAEKLLGSRLL
jgi:molybdenum cofactor cytidylyltransferase